MDINTKEFWEQVKEEYQPTEGKNHICHTSRTFGNMWMHNSEELRALATNFRADSVCNVVKLFLTDDVQIREEFIDWCIDKFSAELNN